MTLDTRHSAPGTRKSVIGLIGGMGSGKSVVAEEFARRGGKIVSGDQFGHEALREPAIRGRVIERWGRQVLDDHGAVDRRKLGAIIFADEAERKALEVLVFPWIEARMREEIEAARLDERVKLVVLDAAIMLEAGWNKVCDRLVYVHSPRELRLRRLKEQRGWSEKEVTAREKAQMSLTDKVSRADHVVDNSRTRAETARQIDDLLRQWGLETAVVRFLGANNEPSTTNS